MEHVPLVIYSVKESRAGIELHVKHPVSCAQTENFSYIETLKGVGSVLRNF